MIVLDSQHTGIILSTGNQLKLNSVISGEVSYWLGRELWGKGIVIQALSIFVAEIQERTLFAREAKDNLASIRVLEKCGFVVSGYDRGYANARGEEIEEIIMILE